MTTNTTQPSTDLYRFYAADGTLLYIGISKSAIVRMVQHAIEKPWWNEVAAVTIERINGTRKDAEIAERKAIRREGPKHNVAHNGGLALPVMEETYDYEQFERESAERKQRLIDKQIERMEVVKRLKQELEETRRQTDIYREKSESLEIEIDGLRLQIGLIQQQIEAEQTRASIEKFGKLISPT